MRSARRVDAGRRAPAHQSDEHIPCLRDGRVGKHPFDVRLGQGDDVPERHRENGKDDEQRHPARLVTRMPVRKTRTRIANPATLGPTDKKAVTGVGAPSYASGAQEWKGTSEILNPKPVIISAAPKSARVWGRRILLKHLADLRGGRASRTRRKQGDAIEHHRRGDGAKEEILDRGFVRLAVLSKEPCQEVGHVAQEFGREIDHQQVRRTCHQDHRQDREHEQTVELAA